MPAFNLCLSLFAATTVGFVPPWVVMVVVAMMIYLCLKFVTLVHFERCTSRTESSADQLAWFFAWPGMNARHFFCFDRSVSSPTVGEWLWAVGKFIFGGLLLAGVAPWATARNELLGGWVAMVGILFLLHFGSLHLSALFWRRAGRPVEPIMRAPLLATSVGEFWSARWNLAFRDFVRTFVFLPLARRFGSAIALLGGFAFSGLIHDLAISVSARGGYGLPTAYFLLQSAGVFAERSAWGRKIGLGQGWRGRMFAVAVTAPAAFLLFHPPFVRGVIVPLIPLGEDFDH